MTRRMRRDEVGDNLLSETTLPVNSVENTFEFTEQRKCRLAHTIEHNFRSMLRSDFQTSAHMRLDKLLYIPAVDRIGLLTFIWSHSQIVSYATANERFFDFRQTIYTSIYVKKLRMIIIQVRTRLGMQT